MFRPLRFLAFKLFCFPFFLNLCVPDEGYSRNASCVLNWISSILVLLLCRYLCCWRNIQFQCYYWVDTSAAGGTFNFSVITGSIPLLLEEHSILVLLLGRYLCCWRNIHNVRFGGKTTSSTLIMNDNSEFLRANCILCFL